MKVLFAGSPSIAVPSLLSVADRHEVVGLLTNPESAVEAGRSSPRLWPRLPETDSARTFQSWTPSASTQAFGKRSPT
jgi:methionyl-tRNA formyltransferase